MHKKKIHHIIHRSTTPLYTTHRKLFDCDSVVWCVYVCVRRQIVATAIWHLRRCQSLSLLINVFFWYFNMPNSKRKIPFWLVDFYCFLYFLMKRIACKNQSTTYQYKYTILCIQKCVLFIQDAHKLVYTNRRNLTTIKSHSGAETNGDIYIYIYKCAMHKRWKIPFRVFSTGKHTMNETTTWDEFMWIYFLVKSQTNIFSILLYSIFWV